MKVMQVIITFTLNILNSIINCIKQIDPIVIDTGITAVHCRWNHNGSLLAVAGFYHDEEKTCNVVYFYSPFGEVFLQ